MQFEAWWFVSRYIELCLKIVDYSEYLITKDREFYWTTFSDVLFRMFFWLNSTLLLYT